MTTTVTNLTALESLIGETFETDELSKIETIAMELRGYGIESVEQFEDSYSGCFPSVDAFCEDLIDSCYNLDDLPLFIQTAIDYEMVCINLCSMITSLSITTTSIISSIVTFS